MLDENIKAFIVHVNFLSLGLKMTIYPAKKVQIALLLPKKVTIPAKHLDFADVFLKESANILSEQSKVNKYAIKLAKGKKLAYKPIYNLELMRLEIFNTYIKTNLVNSFIRVSKLLTGAPILFVLKFNDSLRLYVNYQRLNNFIIKDW